MCCREVHLHIHDLNGVPVTLKILRKSSEHIFQGLKSMGESCLCVLCGFLVVRFGVGGPGAESPEETMCTGCAANPGISVLLTFFSVVPHHT